MRILLTGYFFAGNFGDDLLLASLLYIIKLKNNQLFYILSHGKTDHIFNNIIKKEKSKIKYKKISYNNPFTLLYAIIRSNVFIFTGGILQNRSSFFSLAYYFLILALARVLIFKKKRIILLGLGIDNISGYLGKIMASFFLKWSDKSILRYGSIQYFNDSIYRKKNNKIIKNDTFKEIPDISFGFLKKKNFYIKHRFKPLKDISSLGIIAGNVLRSIIKNSEKDFVILTRGFQLIVYEFDREQDHTLVNEIKVWLSGNVVEVYKLKDIKSIKNISKADLIICSRFHSIILSLILCIPFYIIPCSAKIKYSFSEIIDSAFFGTNDRVNGSPFISFKGIISRSIIFYNKNIEKYNYYRKLFYRDFFDKLDIF